MSMLGTYWNAGGNITLPSYRESDTEAITIARVDVSQMTSCVKEKRVSLQNRPVNAEHMSKYEQDMIWGGAWTYIDALGVIETPFNTVKAAFGCRPITSMPLPANTLNSFFLELAS